MNIVFEGSPGAGKTTIIEKLQSKFKDQKISVSYTVDIDSSTPLFSIINDMHSNTPLVTSNNNFNTLLYETFVQAADYFYLRERTYAENKCINLFDRSFFSVFAYQKVLLEDYYGKYCRKFLKNFRKCLEFELGNIDCVFYVENDIDISLKRAEDRDFKKYSSYEIDMLYRFEKELKKTIKFYESKYKVIYVRNDNVDTLVEYIYDYILSIRK